MSHWRWLLSLPASLALHGAGVLLGLVLFPGGTLPPFIVLDLTVVSHEAASPAPPRPASSTPTARASQPSRIPDLPSPPAPASASAGVSLPPPLVSSTPAALGSNPSAEVSPSAAPQTKLWVPSGPLAGASAIELEAEARVSPEDGKEVGSALPPAPGTGGKGGDASLREVASPEDDAGGRGVAHHVVPSQGGEGGTGSAPGQALALAVPGAGPDGLSAEYGPYLARVRQQIQQALEYPLAARRRGLTGTVHVEIVIRPDGTIGQVSLLRSSSHRILDEAALDTVRGLPPLPFPAEVPPRTLRVRLPVDFELR